jgi:hypothetical protein
MSGIEGIGGVGEAMTGGLAARAVEPGAGEHQTKGEQGLCLNCGAERVGAFCHLCGQSGHVHRTVTAWWHDLAHGVLHLDGKIWRTLPLLAWRPGDLTRRYVAGERARFVSPLALFLFSVFLMFALFSALGAPLIGVGKGKDPGIELQQAEKAVTALEAKRRQLAATGGSTEEVDAELQQARTARGVLGIANGGIPNEPLIDADITTKWKRLDKGIKKANENPALLFYKLQSNAYKFSWALIPISVPFLWLLFLHRRRYREQYRAYDHLIFITYSIAFMSLALVALVLLAMMGLPGGWIGVAIMSIPPIHIFRQLQGAYCLRWYSALWRTVALLFFASVAATLFLLLLIALGVLA